MQFLNETIRQTLLKMLQLHVSPKRMAHILRVEQKAIQLAQQYNVNIAACQYAALLHDFAKEWSMAQFEHAVKQFQLDESLLTYGSEILHGPVAAHVCRHWFEKDDNAHAIAQAIAVHTVGAVEMNAVAKVLFIADYIEDGRQFEGVEMARQLANESLERAILFRLQQTIIYLTKQKQRIHPSTLMAYNGWIIKEKTSEF